MKTMIISVLFSASVFMPALVRGQSHEAQQLLLNWEKLAQLKSILENMYEGYQVISKGYTAIKNISEGNFELHNGFLEGLLQVSPSVRKYKRIGDIVANQRKILSEHRKAFNHFKESNCFSSDELTYLQGVYSNIFEQSLKALDEFLLVITGGHLRMTDDERLEAIDTIFYRIQDMLTFLRSFNNSTKLLAVHRLKERSEIQISKKLNRIE
jgi:hypothetical protein